MNTLLIILLVAAMAATAYVLVRGVIAMAQGKDITGEQQQNWMQKRVLFQAVAIVIVVLILIARQRVEELTLVKLNKIYTRTGDAGETGLVDGSRVSKDHRRGWPRSATSTRPIARSALALAALAPGEARAMLGRIQNELFDLGADLATPGEDFAPSEMALAHRPAAGRPARSTKSTR